MTQDAVGDEKMRIELEKKIKELEIKQFSDSKQLQARFEKFTKSYKLSEDDVRFMSYLINGWNKHLTECKESKEKNENLKKKADTLSILFKKSQDTNKQLRSKINETSVWKQQMQKQLEEGMEDVKGKITLYEQENVKIAEDNKKLREALKKAMDYNEKRNKHVNVLKETNEYLRTKHDEMNDKYTEIFEDHAERYDNLEKEHKGLKAKYIDQITINNTLNKRLQQETEAKDMIAEFDEKYSILKTSLDESAKCIDTYKAINNKLTQQNQYLRKNAVENRQKVDKTTNENKELKKRNKKAEKKVSTLTNLCKSLQSRLKEAEERNPTKI